MTSEQLLGQYIPTVGVAVTLAGIIIAGFKWANQSLAIDLRDGVSLWILGEPGQGSWSTVISQIFESVYGRTYFSRRALIVNLLVAVVATTSSGFVLFLNRWPMDQVVWVGLASLSLVYLLPILFASYLKARWFGRTLARTQGGITALLILFADLCFCALIWLGWIAFLIIIPPYGDNAIKWPLYFLAFAWNVSKPVVIASLFPSLLISLVVAAVVSRRLYVRAGTALGRQSKFLSKERIEKEPLCLIGEVLAALVFLFVCLYGILF